MTTNYTFSMDSDDGSQLYIDGKLLIDKGGAQCCSHHSRPSPRPDLVRSHRAAAVQELVVMPTWPCARSCIMDSTIASCRCTRFHRLQAWHGAAYAWEPCDQSRLLSGELHTYRPCEHSSICAQVSSMRMGSRCSLPHRVSIARTIARLSGHSAAMQAAANAGIILKVTYAGSPVVVVPSPWFRYRLHHLCTRTKVDSQTMPQRHGRHVHTVLWSVIMLTTPLLPRIRY